MNRALGCRLAVLALVAPLAAACAQNGTPVKARPNLQNVITGEMVEDVPHRHWWKVPGYAMFGGH